MPSLLTHYLLGDKTLEKLDNQDLKDLIFKYRQVFNLGTQGPDILFYYRVWPWTNSNGIEKVGEKMHVEKINASFHSAIEFILNCESNQRNLLIAYMCGYICHHTLDLHTHPYIFYKTGFVREGDIPTSKYNSYHRMFETVVDVLMLDRLLHKKPSDIQAHKLIAVGRNEAKSLGEMYEYILLNTYGLKVTSSHVSQAIFDMIRVQSILRDSKGIKKNVLFSIEKSLGLFPLISSMIHPLTITDELDYLNLSHNTWCLPWDNTTKLNTSFTEMFDIAVDEAKELSETLYKCFTGTLSINAALERLGNRSFSTGVDCDLGVEFKYFDCIYE